MSRIDYAKEKPVFIDRLRTITRDQEQFRLDSKLRALVELRVSQINGCVYFWNRMARGFCRMPLNENPQSTPV